MQRLVWACVILCVLSGLAGAGEFDPEEEARLQAAEAELAAKVRRGRLSQDELIRRGEELSYFTKLKLYYYAKELEPFFEGVEDSFRDLARTDPHDAAAIARRRRAVVAAMARAYRRLMASGREDPLADWRRGLLGLIWLDQQWRGRVYEQEKREIKNPYDLVALVDCVDARLRGLEKGGFAECPARLPRPASEGDDWP